MSPSAKQDRHSTKVYTFLCPKISCGCPVHKNVYRTESAYIAYMLILSCTPAGQESVHNRTGVCANRTRMYIEYVEDMTARRNICFYHKIVRCLCRKY